MFTLFIFNLSFLNKDALKSLYFKQGIQTLNNETLKKPYKKLQTFFGILFTGGQKVIETLKESVLNSVSRKNSQNEFKKISKVGELHKKFVNKF